VFAFIQMQASEKWAASARIHVTATSDTLRHRGSSTSSASKAQLVECSHSFEGTQERVSCNCNESDLPQMYAFLNFRASLMHANI
jgi:hypothetical protein